jgi:5-oxoprolinase (ATP-hydrolysing)
MTKPWEFWIDVGGTFTDCIAHAPDDQLHTFKTLSSGVTKGRVGSLTATGFVDETTRIAPPFFWKGFDCRVLTETGQTVYQAKVVQFDALRGEFEFGGPLPGSIQAGMTYELQSHLEAPVLAMRWILGLPLEAPLPPITVKLGTTRGTNALLERRGARTAFLTTQGFRDVLLIGNQDRPRLFDLAIQKPAPLFEQVVEIEERLSVAGEVLIAPGEAEVRKQLAELKQTGVESIAICFLHSFQNPTNEELVERLARETGFEEISRSSRLSPLIKIVSRGDTTVMDAYLNPILRSYVAGIRKSLDSGSRLKMMTSAGGLVEADSFVGKDSILSGPAGGVIGFSRIAERAGFPKSIGFDMGGTSTDVSRYDGVYEREFETQKAGVRVVAPMLAIETVAAGGGSICRFDGVKLAVGPQSAGADPGPACYGRGGPLTVTDVNLFLGKILPSRFPFPLDRAAVEARLNQLCEEIARSPMGKTYTPGELAEGFVKIANANMVRAIRKISVAKGYDPADYVLVTFGGAGGQHACALARELGIDTILLHPYAGILSAYGIGLADVRRFKEQTVLKPCTLQTLDDLEPLFQSLESAALEEVRSEGIAEEHIQPPGRSCDMRYLGIEAAINVPFSPEAQTSEDTAKLLIRRYEELHKQLYGYLHKNRAIEITAVRVEVVGTMPDPPVHTEPVAPRQPQPAEMTEVFFQGEKLPTPVFLRSDLHAGDEFEGPAILCEPTSTIVIDPGFHAALSERGDVLLQRRQSASVGRQPHENEKASGTNRGHISKTQQADPVLLEIFNNLFASIAEQMGAALQRTSFSTNVKERLDFSCAIFDPAGNLVVNAPHIPVHLGAMSETVKRILKDYGRDMREGDVFVTNDPYRGGSHLPDVTVVTPVYERGELVFFTASRAHHAEIGGIVPGSMPPFSKNLAEEGVLIRNFKLIDAGQSREEELKQLLLSGPYPTRSVQDNLADVSAQVAANNSGAQQLQSLVSRYSLPVVQAYMGHIQRAAAEKMRLALRGIPDGTYALTDHLDNGSPIAVSITIEGDRATVDFTGTGPVLFPDDNSAASARREGEAPAEPLKLSPSSSFRSSAGASPSQNRFTGDALQSYNLNANRAIVKAAVLYVFRCLIAEDIPLNSGVLEPVEIVLPKCLLNPPEHDDPIQCAAIVGGNVETSQRVVDVLLGALQVAAASQGTMNNLTFGDETFGYYETICGGSGATPDADGADGVHTHMTNTRLTDVEVMERRYPVRVLEFSLRPGSGGQGKHTGGQGIIRKLEFLKPLKVSMLSERRGPYPPFGLTGGEPGQLGRNQLLKAGNSEPTDLGGKFAIDVEPGDVLIIETPGGGGLGG